MVEARDGTLLGFESPIVPVGGGGGDEVCSGDDRTTIGADSSVSAPIISLVSCNLVC